MGMLLHSGETCQLDSEQGAVIIAIEATKLDADFCGISLPERVAGQQWPSVESWPAPSDQGISVQRATAERDLS
jgi:hypothetical protein